MIFLNKYAESFLLGCHIVVRKDGGMLISCFMKEWMMEITMATLYWQKVNPNQYLHTKWSG